VPTAITLTRPDDWHLHVRDGDALQTVVPHTARQFGRAIIMPNLRPPVTTVSDAAAYRQRIEAAIPHNRSFEPLMTLYLTDRTDPGEIKRACDSGFVRAVKLYPAGATTNSDSGVTALENVFPVLEAMERHDLPLLVHGEVTDTSVDVFDREARFIDQILLPLTERFPELRVVLEHVTTRQGVDFVTDASPRVAATLTAHHLLYNRNAIFRGGIRPHYYCLPILKREEHQQALLSAATSGNAKFFLGTDSAPHPRSGKESDCGCAGIYTAHAAIEFYAEAFEQADALDKLEAFAAFNGADFYRLPRNTDTITLERHPWSIPDSYDYPEGGLIPLRAGETMQWRLVTD